MISTSLKCGISAASDDPQNIHKGEDHHVERFGRGRHRRKRMIEEGETVLQRMERM
jgi:hypothetical protein